MVIGFDPFPHHPDWQLPTWWNNILFLGYLRCAARENQWISILFVREPTWLPACDSTKYWYYWSALISLSLIDETAILSRMLPVVEWSPQSASWNSSVHTYYMYIYIYHIVLFDPCTVTFFVPKNCFVFSFHWSNTMLTNGSTNCCYVLSLFLLDKWQGGEASGS